MAAIRRLAAALVFAVGVFVVGSGLAAVDVWPGDACINGETFLVPYGSWCAPLTDGDTELYRPSTAEFVAWLAATAALFGLVLRYRRSVVARGVAAAACSLALYALLGHEFGVLFAFFTAPFLALPVVYALDRALVPSADQWPSAVRALVIPAPAVFVGSLPWYSGVAEAGVPLALVTGGLLSLGIERISRPSGRAASP